MIGSFFQGVLAGVLFLGKTYIGCPVICCPGGSFRKLSSTYAVEGFFMEAYEVTFNLPHGDSGMSLVGEFFFFY